MPAVAEFRLNIRRAFADQIITSISALSPELLTVERIAVLPAQPGVYQLYLDESLVHVGRASSSLPRELGIQLKKLSGMENIDILKVGFTCLFVDGDDLHTLSPVKLMASHYKDTGQTLWNLNTFDGDHIHFSSTPEPAAASVRSLTL